MRRTGCPDVAGCTLDPDGPSDSNSAFYSKGSIRPNSTLDPDGPGGTNSAFYSKGSIHPNSTGNSHRALFSDSPNRGVCRRRLSCPVHRG